MRRPMYVNANVFRFFEGEGGVCVCVCVKCAGLRISEDVLSWQAVGLVSRVRARGWLFFGMVVFCVNPAVSLFLLCM